MKAILIAAAVFASPVLAQTSPALLAPALAPVDPQRLALAKTTIDRVWPLGTYARMMNGAMDSMMNGMMASIYDMKPGDFVPGADGKAVDKELRGKTMRQMMLERDPISKSACASPTAP